MRSLVGVSLLAIGAFEFSEEFCPGRQSLHIPATLHRPTANPVRALHRLGKTLMLQQGTDHPHCKAVTGTDRVDDIGDRHTGDKS